MNARVLLCIAAATLAAGCAEASAVERTQLDEARRALDRKDVEARAYQWQLATLSQQAHEAQARSDASVRDLGNQVRELTAANATLTERLKRAEADRAALASAPDAARAGRDGGVEALRRVLASSDARNAQIAEELARIARILAMRAGIEGPPPRTRRAPATSWTPGASARGSDGRPMDRPEMKWLGLAAFVAAARETVGEGPWAKVVAELPAETRALLESPPAPIAWVAVDHYLALLDAIVEHAGAGRSDLVRDIARAQIGKDLRGIYRVFVRLMSPEAVAGRAASLYGSYWRNHGRLTTEQVGPRSIDVVYDGISSVRMPFVIAQIGAIEAALEATGVAGVRVTLRETSTAGFRARASWS